MDVFLNFRPIKELVNRRVGIEERCFRQNFPQTFDERAFTRGNPSGDSDGRHSSEDYKQ